MAANTPAAGSDPADVAFEHPLSDLTLVGGAVKTLPSTFHILLQELIMNVLMAHLLVVSIYKIVKRHPFIKTQIFCFCSSFNRTLRVV